ncbi:MAG: inositol monophosphatase family protein [Flavobacteriales bacterium]
MDLSKICNEVIEIARQTGAFILENRPQISTVGISEKSTNNFVTTIDIEAEKRIVAGLMELLPQAGVIAEEKTSMQEGKDYNWVVDPLDGTTNFIHGIPCFAVSIALTKGGEVIMGVVYEINLDECFYAWKGGGAHLNGKKISVSSTTHIAQSLIATGFPYCNFKLLDSYMQLFEYLMKNTHGLRRIGSAATDLAYVACGRFDGFYEYGLNSWDVAAGALIVQEAGGSVTDFVSGNNYIFGGEIVATNTVIHDEFIRAISSFFNQ